MNRKGVFKPFWVLLGLMGILLIGSQITPLRIVLDDAFNRIETSATENGTPELSCTSGAASPIMKATCFTLGGFMALFIIYILYQWVSGMINGANSPVPIFSPRYRKMQAALEA